MKWRRVEAGPLKTDAFTERCYLYYRGRSIGEWHCSRVLQPRYGGEFWANAYGRKLMGGQRYAGGEVYNAVSIIERRLNAKGR